MLQNFVDDGVLGRRLRLGQTQEEARAAITQMTAAELKAEPEVASRELGTHIGRQLHLGKSREEACRTGPWCCCRRMGALGLRSNTLSE